MCLHVLHVRMEMCTVTQPCQVLTFHTAACCVLQAVEHAVPLARLALWLEITQRRRSQRSAGSEEAEEEDSSPVQIECVLAPAQNCMT